MKKEATEARRTRKGKSDRKPKKETEAASVKTFLPLKLRYNSLIFPMNRAMIFPSENHGYYNRAVNEAEFRYGKDGDKRLKRIPENAENTELFHLTNARSGLIL